jgi:hypothetical protein
MSEIQSGVTEVRMEIATVAGPREWGDTRESWLAKVPRALKKVLKTEEEPVTFRTVKSLWYGEIGDENHWAAREIKRAAELLKERREREQQAVALEILADRAGSVDSDFHRETRRAYLDAARLLRSMDCT